MINWGAANYVRMCAGLIVSRAKQVFADWIGGRTVFEK